jgi:ribonuclease Z
MVAVICLGTGAAVPSPGRDNTSLVLDDGRELTLIDASGSPLKRLVEAGLDPARLARIIITHEHLDHTYGYPSLLQSLWLSGRRESLPVYALPDTWRFLDRLVDAYRPGSWTDGFPVDRREVVPGDTPFVVTGGFTVRAARGVHSVPVVGLRITTQARSTLVYTSDTSPCSAITELAQDADVLIHEATFRAGAEELANRLGHSTARQAAEVAAAAGARRLVLIHFTPMGSHEIDDLLADAASGLGNAVTVATDGDRLEMH